MAMNDDLKINFDKVGKACKQAGEEWKNIMKENNPFDTISKIEKDIVDRQDREIALEFTRCICELLKKNGVVIQGEKCAFQKEIKENSIEYKYGVAITGLDFTEHDKRFNDEIKQLKNELEKTYNQLMEVEKDAQERIAEFESELEVKDNLLKIKNGLFGNDEMNDKEPIEIAMDIIKGRNIDDLEQIAQHIQIYCRHARSRCDDTLAF